MVAYSVVNRRKLGVLTYQFESKPCIAPARNLKQNELRRAERVDILKCYCRNDGRDEPAPDHITFICESVQFCIGPHGSEIWRDIRLRGGGIAQTFKPKQDPTKWTAKCDGDAGSSSCCEQLSFLSLNPKYWHYDTSSETDRKKTYIRSPGIV